MFKGKIVKAEILWTRKCNLRCSYCGMVYDKNPIIKKDWELWKRGLDNLKELSGENFFTAVYGAEPLVDFEYLPEYFEYTNKLGFYHTLITNCTVKDAKKKLIELVNAGLNSLTVSFDGNMEELKDKSSAIKSSKGLDTLFWFQKEFKKKYRDLAVVFTLTRTNLFNILEWIPYFSERGIYVFFDLIHSDIGNPGTKCKNYKGIEDLVFQPEHIQLLREFGISLKKLKDTGNYNIHQSYSFIDILINHPYTYIYKTWNCAWEEVFPSWLTIDYDGTTRVCDDFYIKGNKDWKFWDLSNKNWEEFVEYWTEVTRDKCKGCLWNTHWDAHRIKEGRETFKGYINANTKK